MTDFELLAAWGDGDRSAGDQLFNRHFESLYGFFRRKVANRQTTEDLVQTTFLACVEGRDKFRGTSSFRTYLFAVARHKLLDHWRRRSNGHDVDFSVSSLHELSPSPRSQVGARQEQRLLLEALRRIPVDMQIAIELHYWEGMSGQALAEVLGIPEGTVRSRLRRAKQALEQQLAALAESEEQLRSTVSNLETWAVSLKQLVQPAEQ